MSYRENFEDFPVEELDSISDILEGKSNRCTGRQRQWIHSMLDDLGISDREALEMIGAEFLDDEFSSPLREMTLQDASEMIDIIRPMHNDQKRGNYFGGNSSRYNSNNSNNTGGWF